jgi:hypothetical protein
MEIREAHFQSAELIQNTQREAQFYCKSAKGIPAPVKDCTRPIKAVVT